MRFWFILLLVAVLICGCVGPGKKLSVCETKEDQFERDACYLEFAVMGGDLSLCNSIEFQKSKDFCNAVVLKDSSKCDKLEGTDDSRYACYAYSMRDPSYCEKINATPTRVNCYSISLLLMSNESSKCGKFERSEYKDKCYLKIATLSNDSSLCDEIQNQTTKQSCYTKFNHSYSS